MTGQALRQDYGDIFRDMRESAPLSGYLKRDDLRFSQRHISEAPPSNDNRLAVSGTEAIEHVENAIDAQHARIGEMMHKRNADPKNEALKQQLDNAFEELERLEERRAELLRPYMTVKAPRFSEEELRIIQEAERMRSKYGI